MKKDIIILKVDPFAVYDKSEQVIARKIEEEFIIVPVAAEEIELTNELYFLNETGRELWDNLNGKVNELLRIISDPERKEDVEYNLQVLRNELRKQESKQPALAFQELDQLYPDLVTADLLNRLPNHLEIIKRFYVRVSNEGFQQKDTHVKKLQDRDKEAFLELKHNSLNDKLEEFVKNSGEKPLVELNGQLYQKIDPIYMDPEGRFLKAHFYAPSKRIFGKLIPTFWANVIVIWVMTIITYVALSKRLLYRLLESIERLIERLFPSSETVA